MSTSFGGNVGSGGPSSSDTFHYGGYNAQSSARQQQHSTPQRNPSFAGDVGSSSSFMTSGELYASPSQPSSLTKRQSSFRESSLSRRSTSAGFGFSQFDVGQQASTPKNVRFEDASSFPLSNAGQQSQVSRQSYAPSTSAVQQSYNAPFGQARSSYAHTQLSTQLSAYPTTPATQSTFGNGNSSAQPTQALTMSDLQLSQPRQPSTSLSQPAWMSTSVGKQAAPTSTSVFTTSRLADLSKPIAISSMPSRVGTAVSSSSVTQRPSSAISPTPVVSLASQIKDVVITPRSAITARIRWNVAAFLITWLLPYVGPMSTTYWFILSATYKILGGDSDVHVATILSWLRSAVFILTFANIVEALIRLQSGQEAATISANGAQTNGQKRKPSLAFPPNRVVSSSSPKSTTSSTVQQSTRMEPRHFAQNSPLRETIFRASISAQQRQNSSSSPLGESMRLPSQTPSRYEGLSASGGPRLRSSSPAAAYLARKQEQRLTSGTGPAGALGDVSLDADASAVTDLSVDSIEVTRAIRALSASYGREMSEVRSTPTSTGLHGNLVTA